MKKIPAWLRTGIIVGIVGTLLFNLTPSLSLNYSLTPSYAKWFVSIAVFIFSTFCIIFNVDFISDAATQTDRILTAIFYQFSIFITFFLLSVAVCIALKLFKKVTQNKPEQKVQG